MIIRNADAVSFGPIHPTTPSLPFASFRARGTWYPLETALRGRHTQGWQGMVLKINQQRSILKSPVSFRAPGRVCSDGSKRAIRPGLHPRPTLGVVDDLLSWVSVSDAPGDRVGPLPASLCGRRDLGELDGWSGAAKPRPPVRMSAHASFFGETLATHRAVPRPALFLARMLDLGILDLTNELGRKESPLAATNVNPFPAKQPRVYRPCARSEHYEAYPERRKQNMHARCSSPSEDSPNLDD
jgi:hypothetical protein